MRRLESPRIAFALVFDVVVVVVVVVVAVHVAVVVSVIDVDVDDVVVDAVQLLMMRCEQVVHSLCQLIGP